MHLINESTSTDSPFVLNYSLDSGVYYFNASSSNSTHVTNTTETRNAVLFNNIFTGNGSVKDSYKINESRFGNGDELDSGRFGNSVANIGDLDGDGIQDLAVGEPRNDDGGSQNGAVWILFLNTNGSVKTEYKINVSRFGNESELSGDRFGESVANIGDLDGDGIQDLVVGEILNDDGGDDNGAVWILFLNTNGSVKDSYEINESRFGNGSELDGDYFGNSVANIGDLDGDGIQDLAVGERRNDDGGPSNGAVWILFLNTNGSVKTEYKINESRFGNGNEFSGDEFGASVANIGDLDGDGIQDLAVGEILNDDGGDNNGAVWIISLEGLPIAITIHNPEDRNYLNSTVDLNVTSNFLVDTWWWTNDSGVTNFTLTVNTSVVFPEGNTNLQIYANNSLLDEISASVNFSADETFPIPTFVSPTPSNNSVSNDSFIPVNISVVETSEQYTVVDFDTSMIGWWRAEDGANDSSPFYLNGTFNNSANASEGGIFGNSFSFDGVRDYVNLSDNVDHQFTDENFSISMWFKTSPTSEDNYLLHNGDAFSQYSIFTTGEGKIIVNMSEVSLGAVDLIVSPTNLSDFNWHHLVFSFEGSPGTSENGTLYVDGVYANHTDISEMDLILGEGGDLKIGRGALDNDAYYGNGSVDELIIFNRSLTSNEVLSLYNSSMNPYFNNFTGLQNWKHNFTGYTVDISGNIGDTGERVVNVGKISINACQTLSAFGVEYILSGNLNTVVSCFTVDADSVTLNLNGYTVDGDFAGVDIGVSNSGNDNFTVRDGSVKDFYFIIRFLGGNYENISNVTLGKSIIGISFNGNNNTYVNAVNLTSGITFGAFLDKVSNLRFTNFIISGFGSRELFFRSSNYSLIENGTIESGSAEAMIIDEFYGDATLNNVFRNINISGSSLFGISDEGSFNNSYFNINVTSSGTDYFFNNSEIYAYDFWENSIIINDTTYGQIEFINTSVTAAGSNLSDIIKIGNNSIFINTTNQSGFNTTANITFFGLASPITPAVIVDFSDSGTFIDCPDDTCVDLFTSSDNSTHKFNVTHFTNYSTGGSNTAPDLPIPLINTTGGLNISSEDILCSFLISDSDGDNLVVEVNWYKNDSLNASWSYSSQTNGTTLTVSMGSVNTTRYQNWTCEVRFSDASETTAYVNSTGLMVLNQLPIITLDNPTNFLNTNNRTPEFNWSVVDADSDVSFYEINITDYKFSGSQTCENDFFELLSAASFIPPSDLVCLRDNGYYYTWRVRANDSVGFGDWSSDFVVNITSNIIISLPTASVIFGTIGPSGTNDTVDDIPAPFVIQNDGNSIVNISVNATAIWGVETDNSSSYQFKVDNVSGEEGAFNWLKSIISFFDVPITGRIVAVVELNYTDSKDSVEIDINLTVPANEAPGFKTSNITFISSLAEGG